MKTMVFMLLNSLIWLACATPRNTEAQQWGGKWELTLFPYSTKSYAEIFGERKPVLQFEANNKLAGTTGCNHLSGTYTLKQGNLAIGTGIATTKMACAGYEENIFLEALTRVTKSEIQNGSLNLYDGNKLLMVFTKRQ